MAPTLRTAYLHGFASGPLSRKGRHLADAWRPRGVTVELPDLNVPTFGQLRVSAILDALDARDDAAGTDVRWRLVGSSLGGYVAALWASRRPERVDRLLLLCPGFGLVHRWPALLGADGVARWRAQGFLVFPDGAGEPTPLHWGFIEDALTHPQQPAVPAPTLVIHGARDEQVPIDGSREWVASQADARLLEVDDDHGLVASLPVITAEGAAFLQLPEPQ